LVFKGVWECMSTVGILYFGPFNPFCYSPLYFISTLPPPHLGILYVKQTISFGNVIMSNRMRKRTCFVCLFLNIILKYNDTP
jgi:hypothetical protein